MKKLSLLITFSVIGLSFIFIKFKSEPNAAYIYSNVFKNLQDIDWNKIPNYEDIIDNGWKNDKEILQLINQETNNLDVFLTSFQISKCNFINLFDSERPNNKILPWKKIRDIARLAAMNGRLEESRNNFKKAYLIYKTLLKLSYEIEQSECNTVNFATAVAVKGVIYNPLFSLIKNHNLNQNELNELLNILEKYASFKINLIDVMEFEKNWFISFSKSSLYNKKWEKIQDHMTSEEINDYRENYLKILVSKLDDLYKNLENAVKNNSEQKLKEIYDEFIAQAKTDKYLRQTWVSGTELK